MVRNKHDSKKIFPFNNSAMWGLQIFVYHFIDFFKDGKMPYFYAESNKDEKMMELLKDIKKEKKGKNHLSLIRLLQICKGIQLTLFILMNNISKIIFHFINFIYNLFHVPFFYLQRRFPRCVWSLVSMSICKHQ